MEPHKHEKTRKKRKGLWIAMSILLILAAGVVGVGIWQKNNLEAMVQFSQFSQEELEQQLQDNDQQVQDILNAALDAAKKVDSETVEAQEPQASVDNPEPSVEAPDNTAPAPVEPQTEPVVPAEPDVPAQPSVQPPVNDTTQTQPPEVTPTQPQTPVLPAPQPETPGTTQTPAVQEPTKVPETPAVTGPTYEEQLQAIVDRVYALRAEYLQALDDLQGEAVADYKAIPKSQRNKKAIVNFVSTYITKATTLEKQCDGKMDALVKELTQLQKKYGQSMELVEAVKYTYANEKSLKKAWYMSELEKRGMI